MTACGAPILLALFVYLGTTADAFARGESIEVGGGARGPVPLSAAQQTVLAVPTAPAGTRPLATLLSACRSMSSPSSLRPRW